jgi:tetratricopeptide (TPR) repeat protein
VATIELPKQIEELVSAMNATSPTISTAEAVAQAQAAKTQYAALDAKAKQKYRAALKAGRDVLVKAAKAELAKVKKISAAAPSAQSLYEVGSLYQQLGDDANAKEYFSKAIKLDSGHADARNDLALSILRDPKLNAAKIDTALKHLTQAHKIDESLPTQNLAVAQELRSLSKVAKVKPDAADDNLKGVEYVKLGDFDSAKEAFKKAVAADPHNAEALNNLALAYIYSDLDIGKALDAALKALSINPNLPTQQLILATTLARQAAQSKA